MLYQIATKSTSSFLSGAIKEAAAQIEEDNCICCVVCCSLGTMVEPLWHCNVNLIKAHLRYSVGDCDEGRQKLISVLN